MIVKCVVACRDANGVPVLIPVFVSASDYEVENGEHYDKARELAEKARYESIDDALVFDEDDGPPWLFAALSEVHRC